MHEAILETLEKLNYWMLKHNMRGYSIMPKYNQTKKCLEYEAQALFEDGDLFIKTALDKQTALEELLSAIYLHEDLVSTD